MDRTHTERWRRLMVLLEPVHEQALATARRLCRSAAEGDDLYHDALVRAFDKLPSLRDPSRFRSWFYAVLLNRHRNRHRGRFWRRFLPWDEAFGSGREPVGEHGEEWAERSGRASRLARALAVLPPEQREAVVLFEVEGWSIAEIASMQEASVPAVKSRLGRGREALRRAYGPMRWQAADAAFGEVASLEPAAAREGSDD